MSCPHTFALSSNRVVLAALEDGKSIRLIPAARVPDELAANFRRRRTVEADRRRSGKDARNTSTRLCSAIRIAWSRLPRRSADAITSQSPTPRSASRSSRCSYGKSCKGSRRTPPSKRQN